MRVSLDGGRASAARGRQGVAGNATQGGIANGCHQTGSTVNRKDGRSPPPPPLTEVLKRREAQLRAELTDVQNALRLLDENPGFVKAFCLWTLKRDGRLKEGR
jgi:hypothetical protein